MNTAKQPVEQVQQELIEVTSVDHFAKCLMAWHQRQVATIQHFHDMPESLEIVVDEENKEPFKLEGDALKGFRLGLNFAMNYLGQLPFEPEYEDAPEQST